MSGDESESKLAELISQINNYTAAIERRIREIEAERGSTPELEKLKETLRRDKHLDPGMSAEEIRLLLADPHGGVQ